MEEQQKNPILRIMRLDALAATLLAVVLVFSLGVIIYRQNQAGKNIRVIHSPDEAIFRVDLNRAEAPELMLLPGIGEARAKRILDWRAANGRFESFDQFREVAGLSESAVDEIRAAATLGDSTETR